MDKCNANERKKIIFLYLTALSLRAPGEGVICRGVVSPPEARTPHRCAELPYRGAIVCCYKIPPLTGEVPKAEGYKCVACNV